jgi:hypothetical protein
LGGFSVNDARLSSLNDKTAILAVKLQITVSFVRAAGVLAKGRMRPAGRMFDMPALERLGWHGTFKSQVLWSIRDGKGLISIEYTYFPVDNARVIYTLEGQNS